MEKLEFEKEKEKLEQTIDIVKQILHDENTNLKKMYNDFVGNREDLWKIADAKKIHISNLETSLDKPYFARIDFTSDEDKTTSTIYIGKNGVTKNMNIVVTDWRAPISSLYYDAEVGKCSYEAPGGTISGDMSLKRQYEIEKGNLIDYYDVDLVSNDGLLQKYLNSNNDARLKSIVATIQKEQNDVIRKKLFDNLIIQGVAGSGKTTVALHRIAYLVYNYIKSIRQNQYLVIGPNPVFIKYIKSVLPDLDVSGVEQCTFEQYAKNYLDENIEVNSSEKKVNKSINGKLLNDIDKFKSSIKYKYMLDEFLKLFYQSLTMNDLKIGDFTVLNSNEIKEVFEGLKTTRTLSSQIELAIVQLVDKIEKNNEIIMSRYNDYSYELFQKIDDSERDKYRSKFGKEREEIKKFCKSSLRKYFSKGKVTPTKLYKLFVNTIEDFDIYNYDNIKNLKKETLANIKSNKYDFEDLAALIYLKKKMSPDKDFDRFRHTVIDEAQDLGEFNFYVLKETLPNSTFSIFGDLAQSIYDYRGVNNWEEVNNVMFNNDGKIINFNKSYRTTAEIMNVADDVAESIGLGRSDLVVRHGTPVTVSELDNRDSIPNYIKNKIEEYKAKGYKTIAVISKTDLLSNYINDDLSFIGVNIPNVSVNDDLSDDRFRICTISNQLAKGLEFDAVIINDANENIYSSNSSLDMKLLYVAITRALHELDIIYTGKLTKPLNDAFEKGNLKYLKKTK